MALLSLLAFSCDTAFIQRFHVLIVAFAHRNISNIYVQAKVEQLQAETERYQIMLETKETEAIKLTAELERLTMELSERSEAAGAQAVGLWQ